MTAKKTARDVASRAWQRMLSGRRLDLLDPSPLDVEIDDIAHGLARVARWNGQTTGAHIFSVAQHTLLVETVMRHAMPRVDRAHAARRPAARCARIRDRRHDLAVQGRASAAHYKAVEKRLLGAIHIRFGLPPALPEEITQAIKAADRGAAYLEATELAGFSESEAKRLFGRDPGLSDSVRARLPHALDRGAGREAVSGAVQRGVRLASSLRRVGKAKRAHQTSRGVRGAKR